jgi:hypothetical protein
MAGEVRYRVWFSPYATTTSHGRSPERAGYAGGLVPQTKVVLPLL